MQITAKIIFTNHAEERLRECQLTRSEAEHLLNEAEETKLPKELRQDKKEKYHGNNGTLYFINGPIIFTARRAIDRWTFRPILLVITVTNQLVNIR